MAQYNKRQRYTFCINLTHSGSYTAHTFMHSCEAVFEHCQFVDLSEFLEYRAQILLFQAARNLSDKQLDGVAVLHRDVVVHGVVRSMDHALLLLLLVAQMKTMSVAKCSHGDHLEFARGKCIVLTQGKWRFKIEDQW